MFKEKVKLTKAQADALKLWFKDWAHTKPYPNERLVMARTEIEISNLTGWTAELSPLNTIDPDVLAQAVYFGYEVEETKEETLLKMYNNYSANISSENGVTYSDGVVNGIKKALRVLEIKIEGIN